MPNQDRIFRSNSDSPESFKDLDFHEEDNEDAEDSEDEE